LSIVEQYPFAERHYCLYLWLNFNNLSPSAVQQPQIQSILASIVDNLVGAGLENYSAGAVIGSAECVRLSALLRIVPNLPAGGGLLPDRLAASLARSLTHAARCLPSIAPASSDARNSQLQCAGDLVDALCGALASGIGLALATHARPLAEAAAVGIEQLLHRLSCPAPQPAAASGCSTLGSQIGFALANCLLAVAGYRRQSQQQQPQQQQGFFYHNQQQQQQQQQYLQLLQLIEINAWSALLSHAEPSDWHGRLVALLASVGDPAVADLAAQLVNQPQQQQQQQLMSDHALTNCYLRFAPSHTRLSVRACAIVPASGTCSSVASVSGIAPAPAAKKPRLVGGTAAVSSVLDDLDSLTDQLESLRADGQLTGLLEKQRLAGLDRKVTDRDTTDEDYYESSHLRTQRMEYSEEQVESVLHSFYNSGYTVDANQWLMSAQISDSGWEFSWKFLQHDKPDYVQFFGACTLCTKIIHSGRALPLDKAVELRTSLLGKLLECSEYANHAVVSKLCIAVAHLAFYMSPDHWPGVVESIVDYIQAGSRGKSQEANVKAICALTELLRIIPEEFCAVLLPAQKRAAVKEDLEAGVPRIMAYFREILSTGHCPKQVYCSGINALSAWLQFSVPIDNSVDLVLIVFQALHDADLFEEAVECLCNIFSHPSVHKFPGTVSSLLPYIVSLDECLDKALTDGSDTAQGLCRLVTTVCESQCRLLLDTCYHGDTELTHKLLAMVLRCTDAPGRFPTDEQVSDSALYFWYLLQDELTSCDETKWSHLVGLFQVRRLGEGAKFIA
uniref:Xpo1 domain-containing protein n=1 Tax=Macrostomum lignano TaxID=282301 RepID=A0A1I8H7Q6_9PLAT